MNLFQLLENNRGTVSSKLGKELAQKVLNGDLNLLNESIELCSFQPNDKTRKNIRAGAAKVIEIVAEKRPALVAGNLDKLIPALSVSEPQTRWMIIRTFGFCAKLNPVVAEKGIQFAETYINKKEGLILASSADLFLGDYGALSREKSNQVFLILENSMDSVVKNEEDWIMEAFMKIVVNLDENRKELVRNFAKLNVNGTKKATKARAQKLLKLCNKEC